MFLKKIYFLSSDPQPTIMSVLTPNMGLKRAKSAKIYGRIYVFSKLVWTCGPVMQEYVITQELWGTLRKHMLADTCMQACRKHTHTQMLACLCSCFLLGFLELLHCDTLSAFSIRQSFGRSSVQQPGPKAEKLQPLRGPRHVHKLKVP